MKITEKRNLYRQFQKGYGKAAIPLKEKEKENTSNKTTDLQGNGYPSNKRVQN